MVNRCALFACYALSDRFDRADSTRTVTQHGKLSKQDRELLATSLVQGKTETALVVASAIGANSTVAKVVSSMGGTVRYRADDVDYFRVKIPITRFEAFTRLREIEAVDIDADQDRFYFPPIDRAGIAFEPIAEQPTIALPSQRE